MSFEIPGHKTTDTPRMLCPRCGELVEAATSVDGMISPSPGDVSICFDCGAILIFDAELRIRLPSIRETIELRRSKQWPQLARMSQRARNRRKARRHAVN